MNAAITPDRTLGNTIRRTPPPAGAQADRAPPPRSRNWPGWRRRRVRCRAARSPCARPAASGNTGTSKARLRVVSAAKPNTTSGTRIGRTKKAPEQPRDRQGEAAEGIGRRDADQQRPEGAADRQLQADAEDLDESRDGRIRWHTSETRNPAAGRSGIPNPENEVATTIARRTEQEDVDRERDQGDGEAGGGGPSAAPQPGGRVEAAGDGVHHQGSPGGGRRSAPP